MFRTLLILVLLFNAVVCPLRCTGACPQVETSTAVVESGCCHGCCSEQESSSSTPADSEEQPGKAPVHEDCGCSSCFCSGAVLSQETSVPGSGRNMAHISGYVTLDISAGGLSSYPRHMDTFKGSLPAGKTMRIAHESLLN